jgi:hypothetical protein
MNQPDPISLQIDVIARLLETAGYAIDVDYVGATIIVWCENWPLLVQIKRQKAKGKKQKGDNARNALPGTDDG